MLHVTILMVGKTREAFIQEGVAFYVKRLAPYLHLTVTSVREAKEAGGLAAPALKLQEGQRLLAQIPSRSWTVALTPGGREFSTEAFAAWLLKREETSLPLAFLIGGHWGLSDEVLAAAHERLALSRLTLTHELARLVLLEQLYRAMTIKAGHPYHV